MKDELRRKNNSSTIFNYQWNVDIKRKNDKQGNYFKVSTLFREIFAKIGVRPHKLREFLTVVTSNIDAFYKPKRYFPNICASSVDI